MTKSDFQNLLIECTKHTVDFAKNYVHDDLPEKYRYTIKLNCSSDSPTLVQFDLYPEDNDKVIRSITAEEVIEVLCRNEKVPVWIDISVLSVNNGITEIQLHCAGRYSSDPNEFYYEKSGTGPFGIKSPVFPSEYKNDGTKFYLNNKGELIELATEQEFLSAIKLDKAIIYFLVDWSGPERHSRKIVYETLNEIGNGNVPTYMIDSSDQDKEYVVDWLKPQKSTSGFYYGGWGETILVSKGKIVDFIRNPSMLGKAATKEKMKLWIQTPASELPDNTLSWWQKILGAK